MNTLIAVLLLFLPLCYSHTWFQIGNDINVQTTGNFFSCSISLSGDGFVLAIGAIYNEGSEDFAGHVQAYEWDGENGWVQRGNDIYGDTAGDLSGYSVSLSANGSLLAVGSPYHDPKGRVKMYEWDGRTSWVSKGSSIDGEAAGDLSGWSVSLSGDGTALAIGAPNNGGSGNNAGHVRVYKWNGGGWVKRGSDIDGEAAGDQSGWSVSLSGDESVLAIGAPYNSGAANNTGHVRVYKWNGGGWVKRGGDIDGEAEDYLTGWSVSLNEDGSVLAVGARGSSDSETGAGHVRVYEWNGVSAWVRRGDDIVGKVSSDSMGASVSLSWDGSVVANGAPYDNGFENITGNVRVYGWDNGFTGNSSATPSALPTVIPSALPTVAPSATPTAIPTVAPSVLPTVAPSATPTAVPTVAPSATPTVAPSATPTAIPTVAPTATPTVAPSATPTAIPTVAPTATPTVAPSATPTATPTVAPSATPTAIPTVAPSATPTAIPTVAPSALPTSTPSVIPTATPSGTPSALPTLTPTSEPTGCPSSQPTGRPTNQPSSFPSSRPTGQPTSKPTGQPSSQPSSQPTSAPSRFAKKRAFRVPRSLT